MRTLVCLPLNLSLPPSLFLSIFYPGRVVSNFIIQALEGKPLTVSDIISDAEQILTCPSHVCIQVFAPGTQTRSFMYVRYVAIPARIRFVWREEQTH